MIEREKSIEKYAEMCTVEVYNKKSLTNLKRIYQDEESYRIRWTFNTTVNGWKIKIATGSYHQEMDSEAYSNGNYGYVNKKNITTEMPDPTWSKVNIKQLPIPVESIKIAIENFLNKIN
ncbi:MAG: hypothetical protein COX80_03020 [Candidatus Magasanikbacteria bacterium CG_4_10_14_0_2_um_filter_33_14]|uniref:Uncharacterized protein n=1 Tax=Candidatus Magasanikbacteria bacterium CG_4_10_14_0_2_um_filter_33_14 TaxID=1974636 RepID=A0A2M7VAW7_9BACT|nr:MAG: hypothetical protein COX80_03020 [Candidatus Magasanikbacteria bacterium CG_4_10_14_0_2_um_filter_33_14]